MKFIVSSSSLLKSLQQVGGIIGSNTVLPILEDFHFDINNNELSIMATNIETVMRTKLEISSSDTGKICIPSKILLDSLKSLPDQPVSFSIDENYAIDIVTDTGKYRIVGESADSFPKEPSKEDAINFSITSNALLTAINKTLFATSSDDLRPAMTGVYFELAPTNISFVATDAHRLVKYTRHDVSVIQETSFIVPKKPLNLLKNILADNDDQLMASYNDKYLFVSNGTFEMSCKLIDANFPAYQGVIPIDNPYTLIVNKTTFQSALRRVNVFANKSTNQVAFTISANELLLMGQDTDFSFEGSERIPCQYDGEALQIGFNAKFLTEMLSVIDSEDVKVHLSTPSKAGILKPTEKEEKEDLLMLAMPLMLNS